MNSAYSTNLHAAPTGQSGQRKPMTNDELNALIHNVPDTDLRTLRAIINGKLSRRTITQEQQDKMIAARNAKKSLSDAK